MIDDNIFIQIPMFIFWKDKSHVIRGCNNALANAAGFNCVEEVVGKTDYELYWGDAHADLYIEGDLMVLDGLEVVNHIEPQLQINNRLVQILINKKVWLDEQNQVKGVVGSYMELRDIKYHGKLATNKNNIGLTERQAECLLLLAKGLSSKQIANHTESSIRTIEHRIESLKEKLNCMNKSELINKALTIDFIKARLF